MADISQIITLLPKIIAVFQVIFYVFFSWFFGTIALIGMRKHMRFLIKLPLSFAVGFIILIVSTPLAGFLNLYNEGIMKIIQADLFISGLTVSILFAFSFYLITYRDAKKIKSIEALQKKIMDLEAILVKNRIPPIEKKMVTDFAEKKFKGYKTKSAEVKENFWELSMNKGKKEIKVMMGAYDREVRDVIYGSRIDMLLSNPPKLAGVLIIVGMIIFSLIFFRDLPSMDIGKEIADMIGMPAETYEQIFGEKNLPEGCVPAAVLSVKYSVNLPVYENADLKALIESSSGLTIKWMHLIDVNGKNYVLSIDETFEHMCSSTETTFCECIETPSG